jgi:hypothetical protein
MQMKGRTQPTAWLRTKLLRGPECWRRLERDAAKQGFSREQLFRAADELGVISFGNGPNEHLLIRKR